jgi:TonB family protein
LNEYAQAEQTGGIDITVAAEYLHQRDPADDLPLPAGMYRIGGDVIAPEAVQRSEPEYSEEARLAGLEGTVLLTGVITENGLAREMRVTRSLGLGLDERAFDAVKEWRFSPGSYQGRPVPVLMSVAVDFRLPAGQSRWHLVRATFQTPEGAFRPAFRRAKYPTGAGVGIRSIEQARVVAAVGRLATVTVSFEVDKHGVHGHFQVRKASAALWGDEAIALLSDWRFLPGTKDGVPISVPCTLGFVWGQRKLTAEAQSRFSTVTVAPEFSPTPEDFFPPEAVVVGRGRQASGLMTKVTPEYPLLAQQARIQGPVLFAALVGTDGHVKKLHVINGNPLLVPTAIGAVKKWVYRPTIVSGKPVEVATEIEVNFTLPGEVVIR